MQGGFRRFLKTLRAVWWRTTRRSPDPELDGLVRQVQGLDGVDTVLLRRGDECLGRSAGPGPDGSGALETALGAGPYPPDFPAGTWLVPDTAADPRWAGHPAAKVEPAIRFYAEVPLRSPEGSRLGVLHVAGPAPRPPGAARFDDLQALAGQIALRLRSRRLAAARSRLQLSFVCGVGLLLGLAVFGAGQITDYLSSDAWVTHTHEVIRDVRGILFQVQAAESGQRGYTASGDPNFLVSYRTALTRLPVRLVRLRVETADNPVQQRNFRRLRRAIEGKIAATEEKVAQRTQLGAGALAPAYFTGRGRRAMETVLARGRRMIAVEGRLLRQRTDRRAAVLHWLIGTLLLTGTGGLGLVVGSFRTTNRALGRSQDQAEELARTNRDLTEEVAERRRAEAELARARDEALAAARVKAEFLANMSHEIRTPLNGIIGMSDLLAETGLDPAQRDYARTVQDCSTGLLGVINDILDFSKIEAGKLELERVDFDLLSLVESQVGVVAARAAEKSLTLLSFVEPALDGMTVRGDSGRVGQVLLNLLSNAVKFTGEGGSVLVRAERGTLPAPAAPGREDGPGTAEPGGGVGRVRFSVKDNGVGLSETARAKLFQPFTQADGSTARRFGGTGLGLSICKRLVELMGGEIGVESREGAGATFWFELPLPGSAPAGTARPGPVTPAGWAGRRVLVIEDDPAAAEVLREYLRAWGLEVHLAGGGGEGLRALRGAAGDGRGFDAALVDWRLPDLSGFELAAAVRRDSSLAALPLVLITAFDQAGRSRERAREAGFSAWLRKPFRKQDLLEALGTVLPPGGTADRSAAARADTNGGRAGGEDRTGQDRPADAAPNGRGVLAASPSARTRVLVAEDNPVNQRLILAQLRSLGYQAQAVANGQEALVALAGSAFDLLLLDCQMPEMDGYEVARAVRKREGGERAAGGGSSEEFRVDRLPIVALTANALGEDRARCLEAGMDDYLSKPVRKERLAEALDRWLAGS